MTLPVPNLDDRHFQQLVDDAKRFIQDRCPTWTNHNVSDPGVTLVETFAWMTDLLLYRLNRVPDRNYLRFLELVGVRLFPPVAAGTEVSFRLSAQQDTTVLIPKGTVVSTRRTATERAIEFTTMADLSVVPARSVYVGSSLDDQTMRDHNRQLGFGGFTCFDARPKPGDALYIGFDRPAPSLIVLLKLTCAVAGHGIDPNRPPLVWEAWDGGRGRWRRCPLEQDTTLGLNANGVVELHLPAGHAVRDVGGVSAAWVRCRVVTRPDGAPGYRESPRILNVLGAAVGGDVAAVHGAQVPSEILGTSDGVPGQVFRLGHAPVPTTSEPIVIEVGDPDGSGAAGWQTVGSFAVSGTADRHVTVDPTSGEVRFGPLVRQPDGSIRQHGAVPPKGATIQARPYQTGGGQVGNVVARGLNTLRTSIPYVANVYNRLPAKGGVDGETVDEARIRGPLALRHRDRAVTLEDYESLTLEAAPELARVHSTVDETGEQAGVVRVLVVPRGRPDSSGRLELGQLLPPDRTLRAVRDYLDARRMVGARVSVEPPHYVPFAVVARLRCVPSAEPDRVRDDALRALHEHFSPITGGPDATGWPFGRVVTVGDVLGALQPVPGFAYAETTLLYEYDPAAQRRGGRAERIDVAATGLVFGIAHQLDVSRVGR
jgi:predicted phage baseplate assembly protein